MASKSTSTSPSVLARSHGSVAYCARAMASVMAYLGVPMPSLPYTSSPKTPVTCIGHWKWRNLCTVRSLSKRHVRLTGHLVCTRVLQGQRACTRICSRQRYDIRVVYVLLCGVRCLYMCIVLVLYCIIHTHTRRRRHFRCLSCVLVVVGVPWLAPWLRAWMRSKAVLWTLEDRRCSAHNEAHSVFFHFINTDNCTSYSIRIQYTSFVHHAQQSERALFRPHVGKTGLHSILCKALHATGAIPRASQCPKAICNA